MTAPIRVHGDVTFRFTAPGLRGPVERTVVMSLDQGLVTAPEVMRQLDFESDCKVHIKRWLNNLKKDRRVLEGALESTAYMSAVLIEAMGGPE